MVEEGRKDGGEDDTEGGKERQKRWVSRGLRNGEREQGRRRKRAPSIPYLCYLKPFECTWLGDINAKLCCARITDLIRDDRAKEGDRRRDPDMWLVRFQTSELLPTSLIFQGSKKKKKKRVSCSLKNNRVSRVRVGSVQLANKRDVTEKRSSGRTRWFDVIKLS